MERARGETRRAIWNFINEGRQLARRGSLRNSRQTSTSFTINYFYFTSFKVVRWEDKSLGVPIIMYAFLRKNMCLERQT